MSITKTQDQYVDLKNNGRLFPVWILHNFKKYKLPKVLTIPGVDPCKEIKKSTSESNIGEKLKLRQYQEFAGRYLDPNGPYNEIILYHGLGSGKTATSINILNILYNYDHNINVIILIKASLHDDPWMSDMIKFLERDPSEEHEEDVTKLKRYATVNIVHYDSPFANKEFMDLIKKIDTTKRTLYFIDEAHNFIRNVYSNIGSKTGGKRAQEIYDYIIKDRQENKDNKLVLISATPGINTPYELALMFNMLRPGTLPSSESEFNREFITDSAYPILSPQKRNLFQRRIMGLVSYYIGSTPDLFATQELIDVNLKMSKQQYTIYRVFEEIEAKMEAKAKRVGKTSQLYRTYTRQACNFVFPYVSAKVNGENRPRPNAFRLSEKAAQEILKGKNLSTSSTTASMSESNLDEKDHIRKYIAALEVFITETERYFMDIHESDKNVGRTIYDDLNDFVTGFNSSFGGKFRNYYDNTTKRSKLFEEMYVCSPKMLAIVFTTAASSGKVMIYTNYVIMEGIDLLKVYFRLIGFNDYSNSKEFLGYCEYHGRMDKAERKRVKKDFNRIENIKGKFSKVILLSPSATEGIQLYGIRQEHILEPYFTEVRIQQVIGRGFRMCAHVDLDISERNIKVYRYKVIKPDKLDDSDTIRQSTDEIIEDLAKQKDNLIQSFLSGMKEAAVDCELFREHNMMSQSYNCFKFPESVIMDKNVGPAYKEDIKDDVKYDSGLNAKNTRVERIKVIKIQAVYPLDRSGQKFSKPDKYWFYAPTGMVYDYETHYPVGYIETVNEIFPKLDKDTYIITENIKIPTIIPTKNL